MNLHFRVVPLLALLCCCTCTTAWEHVIDIDPEKGNNTQECIDGIVPCMNLSFAFQREYRRNSTQYVLLPGTHYLDNSTYSSPFTNLADFAIVGNGSDSVIECNAPNSGLAFVAVSNVYLERVTFSHCAGLRDSTSRNFTSTTFTMQKTRAALYFYLCSSVSMNLVTVTYSRNATGVIMYNTIGSNTIVESTFSYNTVEVSSPYPGGGGFYVEFSYCAPGGENCPNEDSNTTSNHNASYFFSNCTFAHNKADSIAGSSKSTYILPLGSNHIAFGRGGGLSIFFNGRASGNQVNISNCRFANNTALWGGGLFVEFHDSAGDNHVNVNSNSTFIENQCSSTNDEHESGTGGGGMRIGHYVYGEAVGHTGNSIVLTGCLFYNNSASNGGALSVSPSLQDTVSSQLASVNISSCNFEKNTARLGAAVRIAIFSPIIKGNMLSIHFTLCSFVNNSIRYTNVDTPYQAGVGSMYVNGVLVCFRDEVSFQSNNGSALAVVGTPIDFMNCTAIFLFNRGSKGGGIALLGASAILINESTVIIFRNNTAEIHGGAIYNKYIERENFATYPNCFIRHYNASLRPNDWGAIFLFIENHDSNGKNAVYSTSILPCTWAGVFINTTSEIFCLSNSENGNCSQEVSSEPGNIHFTDPNDTFLKTFPGQTLNLPLVIKDDFNHDISTQTVFVAASNDTAVAKVQNSSTYVSGETLAVTGIENRNFTLELDSAGDRVWHVQFIVELQNCPPGFKADNTNSASQCVCSQNIYLGSTVYCDINSFNTNLTNGYWMGVLPDNNTRIVVAFCPSHFCYINPNQGSFLLPNSIKKLDEFICGRIHRTGILCGGCEDGYGTAVNSETYDCVPCNNTNTAANATYYVLSVYLPLTILFVVIILFNIRLTTGPANAFIIYSQVLSSTFILDAEGQIPLNTITKNSTVTRDLLTAYKLPYGIFNLEFIENVISPFCLGSKLNTLDVIALDYFVALFPLLMIIIIVSFIKLKSCFTNLLLMLTRHQPARIQSCLNRKWRIGDGFVHPFAAFLLLSYNKFCLISLYLVSHQSFYDENGSKIAPDRVYFAGNYTSTDREYILKYRLPAGIILATFVAIPPLLLLEYPVKWLEWCISKVECLWRFYPVDKVHILLDTFQGCYRNKMRFFAGLYFLFRLILYVPYILTETWNQQFIAQQITCTVFIVLIALCRPYTKEKEFFNYVDILMFTNLSILNTLSWYLYNTSQSKPGQPLPALAFVMQYILVFLPLLYMIVYILYDLSHPCHQKIKHLWLFRKPEYRNLDEIISDDASEGTQNEDDIEALFERAERENTYRPIPVNLPVAEVDTYPTGMRPRGSPSEDSGLRTHQTSINTGTYGSTASRTVSMQTPPDSSGQTTGSSNKVIDNS